MFLYLVQHGAARREEEDPNRDLSAQGVREVTRLARYVRQLNLPLEQIFHSGKTRARSTAAILGESQVPPQAALGADSLNPLDDPEVWAGRIAKMDRNLTLVGHLPHLARLAALLLCGNKENNVVNFKMAGLVCLRRSEEGLWAVEWMVIPEILPEIAHS